MLGQRREVIVSISFKATPFALRAIREEAPQSIRKFACLPVTWKQVLNRPPLPNASPHPINCTFTFGLYFTFLEALVE